VEKLYSFINNELITIQVILQSEISIKDKRWFVWNNCELSSDDKTDLALKLAWGVLPIYENKHPNDIRVRECLQATEDFKKGSITKNELWIKRLAAAAAYAADAAADAKFTYSQKIQQILIDFVK